MSASNTLLLPMIALMGGALLLVLAGLVVMLKGGKTNEKYGNLLMRGRIALQFGALALFALYFFTR